MAVPDSDFPTNQLGSRVQPSRPRKSETAISCGHTTDTYLKVMFTLAVIDPTPSGAFSTFRP